MDSNTRFQDLAVDEQQASIAAFYDAIRAITALIDQANVVSSGANDLVNQASSVYRDAGFSKYAGVAADYANRWLNAVAIWRQTETQISILQQQNATLGEIIAAQNAADAAGAAARDLQVAAMKAAADVSNYASQMQSVGAEQAAQQAAAVISTGKTTVAAAMKTGNLEASITPTQAASITDRMTTASVSAGAAADISPDFSATSQAADSAVAAALNLTTMTAEATGKTVQTMNPKLIGALAIFGLILLVRR